MASSWRDISLKVISNRAALAGKAPIAVNGVIAVTVGAVRSITRERIGPIARFPARSAMLRVATPSASDVPYERACSVPLAVITVVSGNRPASEAMSSRCPS